jgi:ATP-dependent exoDNAse (exonuclease V) beta subunit
MKWMRLKIVTGVKSFSKPEQPQPKKSKFLSASAMIDTAPLDSELIRIAYVAMTRPRKLLVVALPVMKNNKSFKRLPLDKWIYTQI